MRPARQASEFFQTNTLAGRGGLTHSEARHDACLRARRQSLVHDESPRKGKSHWPTARCLSVLCAQGKDAERRTSPSNPADNTLESSSNLLCLKDCGGGPAAGKNGHREDNVHQPAIQ